MLLGQAQLQLTTYASNFLATVNINKEHFLIKNTSLNSSTFGLYTLANNCVHLFSGHTDGVTCCTIYTGIDPKTGKSQGIRIVSGSNDGTLRRWDAATGRQIGEPLRGHTGPITCCTSYNKTDAAGKQQVIIVSGSVDNTLRRWDAAEGRQIGEPLRGHNGMITCCTSYTQTDAAGNNEVLIVSGSGDSTVRHWNAATGMPILHPIWKTLLLALRTAIVRVLIAAPLTHKPMLKVTIS